jgi:hypothetical protein
LQQNSRIFFQCSGRVAETKDLLDGWGPDLINKVPNEFRNFVLIPSPREFKRFQKLLLNIKSHRAQQGLYAFENFIFWPNNVVSFSFKLVGDCVIYNMR